MYALFGVAIAATTGFIWIAYIYFVEPSELAIDTQIANSVAYGISYDDSETIKDEYKNSSNAEILEAIKEQFSIDVYQQQIEEQEQKIQAKFKNADIVERIVLERELTLLQAKIKNHRQLYNEKVQLLFEAYLSLRAFKEILSRQDYNQAQAALIKGDTNKANNLFSQVESKYRNAKERHEINRAAEAVYQRGKIAQDQIDYRKAYRYYRRAVQYNPNNIEYLVEAGNVSDSIALYSNAILYYEAALYIQQKDKNKSPNDLRQLWLRLGNAWNSKGNVDKAIEFFELALDSDLKTFGPNHPNVAMDKNHLGSAWESKANRQKAIQYYTQAMEVYETELGKTHPTTLSVKENMERTIRGGD